MSATPQTSVAELTYSLSWWHAGGASLMAGPGLPCVTSAIARGQPAAQCRLSAAAGRLGRVVAGRATAAVHTVAQERHLAAGLHGEVAAEERRLAGRHHRRPHLQAGVAVRHKGAKVMQAAQGDRAARVAVAWVQEGVACLHVAVHDAGAAQAHKLAREVARVHHDALKARAVLGVH